MMSFRFPGASSFAPNKPAGKTAAGSTVQKALVGKARALQGTPSASGFTAAATAAQKQTKLLRKGRPGATTGITAKLGQTQVRRPGASVLG